MNEKTKKAVKRYLEMQGYGMLEEVEDEENMLFSPSTGTLVSYDWMKMGDTDYWPNRDEYDHAAQIRAKLGADSIERVIVAIKDGVNDRALLRHERNITCAKGDYAPEGIRTAVSEDVLQKMMKTLEIYGYRNMRSSTEESYIYAENDDGIVLVSCDEEGEAFGGRTSAESIACNCIPDNFESGVKLVMMQAIFESGILKSYKRVYNI